MTVELRELEYAVCDVIQIIKQIPELADSRLAVIGGLALWHYLPGHHHRPTETINFITNLPTLELLKGKLLRHPNSPFTKSKQALFYHSPAGRVIQIKFSPQWLFPYLPDSTQLIHEIPYGEVPYITAADLFFFKLNASLSTASSPTGRRQDADDAMALISQDPRCRLVVDGVKGVRGNLPAKALEDRKAMMMRCREKEGLGPDRTVDARTPVVILSPQQEKFIRDALRGEDLTLSSVMHSPPLET
ncbi:hypothetical protein F5Y14DRAFT_446925 [Nemania sp. NC0429]|nr:hypothetical protein F5Y14DRAFT_446925 [Nemania sp. NC0429]